jgi:crotonobetainyl-CoA:carnitine CoA-transferase CaiB-like acyl-CoA transferase
MQKGALDGIRVIDVTTAVLGPLATRILGDLGADVVKIEAPEGDPMRGLGPARHDRMAAMFLALNRNKRSVVLNLKDRADRTALGDLVVGSDVFVHNMRPEAARRLNIDYSALSASNPRLIHASACAYAGDNPLADKPAYDEIVQGASGIASLFERASGEARYAPFVMADKIVGHELAAAIVAALFARERTGQGQQVTVPMFETMVAFNFIEHLWGHVFDPPVDGTGYSRLFARERRPFRTQDGHICVAATTDQQWARLFKAVGRADLADDERFASMARRTSHFPEAFEYLATELAKESTAYWSAIFEAADLPYGPANSLEGLLSDEYLNRAGFFRRYEHPSEGSLVSIDPTTQFSETPAGFTRPPPGLGEHTNMVLSELRPPSPDVHSKNEINDICKGDQ